MRLDGFWFLFPKTLSSYPKEDRNHVAHKSYHTITSPIRRQQRENDLDKQISNLQPRANASPSRQNGSTHFVCVVQITITQKFHNRLRKPQIQRLASLRDRTKSYLETIILVLYERNMQFRISFPTFESSGSISKLGNHSELDLPTNLAPRLMQSFRSRRHRPERVGPRRP